MFKYRKCLLLISIAMLILILVPISFAQEMDDNLTSDDVLDDSSLEITYPDDDNGAFINIEENEMSMEEGENAEITGDVYCEYMDHWDVSWLPLNIRCEYNDVNGTLRSYDAYYDENDGSFTFKLNTFEGLTGRDSPYILNFTVVDDELYEEFQDSLYRQVTPAQVFLNVAPHGQPPVVPAGETFTPRGQIYVSEDGNDSWNGTQEAPFATVQRALDENNALGGSYEVIVNAGKYYLQNAYEISNTVRITGRGKAIISNEGQGYIFYLNGMNIWEFNNLTITRGIEAAISGSSTYGGSGNAGKVLNIYNCTFEDNYGLVGVIVSYFKTTILNSTFINNQATGTSGIWQGLISARDGSLTVNYCNFIDNTVVDGKSLIYSDVKGNANYNFWGNNSGPKASDVSNLINHEKWAVIVPCLTESNVAAGENYIVNVEYKYTNGSGELSDFNISMPSLDVDLEADLGSLTPSTLTVSGRVNATYTSDLWGNERIHIKLNGRELSFIEFDVAPAFGDRIYVSMEGSDSNNGNQSNPLRTIKAAILKNKALGGGKTIIISPGQYNEHDLEITDRVTILAEDKGTVTIDALGSGRIMVVDCNANITNIIFKNGFIDTFDGGYGYGGAIFHNSGNLTITNCTFESNTALSGGAIGSWATSEDVLEIYDSQFKSNTISEYSNDFKGSTVTALSGILLDNCSFIHNTGGEAYGTVYLGQYASIINSRFFENQVSEGGAIYVDADNRANIYIAGNEFESNVADNGGAIYVALSNTTIMENNTFNHNSAAKGGAIYLYGTASNNVVSNNEFMGNSIHVRNAYVVLQNNNVTDDDAQIIVEGGYISDVVVTYLKNETVKVQNGSIQINATLSDDAGNLIAGGEITFTSEGVNIGKASVVNGSATISHYFGDGDYLISGNYSGFSNGCQINTGLLRVNVKNYWFIDETGYETLKEAIDASKTDDIIKGIPGEYIIDPIQVGHRTRPDEPWVINKQFTVTSLTDEPIILKTLGKHVFDIDYYSNVTCINVIFTGARNPEGWGGAIYSMGHNTLEIDNCTFVDNYAYSGAAIHTWGGLIINNSLFSDNIAAVYGGAVFKDSSGDLLIENTKFLDNSAYTYGGALYTMGYSDIVQVIRNVTFDGNDATCAGAFFTSGKNVTVTDCNFTNNRAVDKSSGYVPCGGAVYVHMGATTFTNVNFINNYAEGTGGALQLDNSLSSVVNSTGRHRTIYWAILNNCLVENNTAEGDGGAFYTSEYRTYVNVTDSIIRNNTASNAALFVSLYSFYTLKNVTVENNRNVAGDALVYSYGMFDLIEYFYANTTIIDCKFKDNPTDIVIKATNEYAVVNISDTSFDGCGVILTSINAAANLTGNVETNPVSSYSVNNNGNLSLSKNNFTNAILNTGNIDTLTYLIVMENQTVVGEIGEDLKLTARIFDDNGNVILGTGVVFVINSTVINSNLEDDVYVANYTVKMPVEVVNAIYSDLGLLNLNTKTATILGKIIPVIHAEDVEFNLTGKLNITLTDKDNSPFKNANITISIGDAVYNRTTDENGFASVDLNLPEGEYVALIIYDGDDQYGSTSKSANVTVNKLASSMNVSVGEAKVQENISITVTLPGDATGNVTVMVSGNVYVFDVADGVASGNISNLTLGNYDVTVTYSGDERYYGTAETVPITVVKCESYVQIDVSDVILGGDAVINIIVPPDATGDLIIVCGKEYLVSVNDGKANYTIPNLPIGLYAVEVTYNGDKKYLDSSNRTSFEVKSPIRKSSITISTIKEEVIIGVLKDDEGNALAGENITYVINNLTKTVLTNATGEFEIPVVRNTHVDIFYDGNENVLACNLSFTFDDVGPSGDVKLGSVIKLTSGSEFTSYAVEYSAGERGPWYKVTLTDSDGNALANATVYFSIAGKTYEATSDSKGVAKFRIQKFKAATYTGTVMYLGDAKHNATFKTIKITVKKKTIQITAKKKTFKAKTKTKKYTITVKTIKGSSANGKTYLKAGKKLTLKIKGKTYAAKTNKKGKVTFKIKKLTKKGKYTAVIKFKGNSIYKKATKKIKITIK